MDIVQVGKFSVELRPSNIRDCPSCTPLILVSPHLTPASATAWQWFSTTGS